jgi:hypothetical protein
MMHPERIVDLALRGIFGRETPRWDRSVAVAKADGVSH